MMDICYAIADEKGTYSKFLGTSLWSLCERHGAKDLHIHLLHDGSLREKEKLRFRQAAMHFGQQLSFYNVEVLAAAELDYLRQELPQAGVSRYTYAAFYRLLAARLLPREVKRFIYFDADTVIHMDIANLCQINLEGYPLAAVAEYDEVGYPADNLMVAAGWMDGKAYFNSGVLLVDREKFLAQGDILRAGIKRLKQLEGFVFYDQDILNAYFANGYKHLNIAYMRLCQLCSIVKSSSWYPQFIIMMREVSVCGKTTSMIGYSIRCFPRRHGATKTSFIAVLRRWSGSTTSIWSWRGRYSALPVKGSGYFAPMKPHRKRFRNFSIFGGRIVTLRCAVIWIGRDACVNMSA